jgi:murein DD-endopeptidase MepM/ murein hydrolase activator NlpD
MKSGILATTTLLVILGAVEQVQAQVNTDEDFEFDVTEFAEPSADAFVATMVAGNMVAEKSDASINLAGQLAWQTDFGLPSEAIASTITPTEELEPLSPVTEATNPMLADFRTEATENSLGQKNFLNRSNQFRPHVPPRTATPTGKPPTASVGRENRSRTATRNYSDRNHQESLAHPQRNLDPNYDTNYDPNYPLSASTTALEVALLSPDSVHNPAIPPLASATAYLPELHPERPVFNGYNWPAQGIMTSGYGWRWGRMHHGIDIAGPIGTPIVAAADGVVITSEWHSGGYGNFVEIEHPDGSITLYAHNSENRVEVGQVVKQGELIAFMGSTGYSTGPHLHFELHLPGQGTVNPMVYLPSSNSVANQHW